MPVSKNRRKKPKKKSTRAAGEKTPLALVPDSAPPLPDRRAMESTMARLATAISPEGLAAGETDALWQAQELMYDAWEAKTPRQRIRLAKRALKISDLCADAHSLLAQDEAKTLVEAREHYERAVDAGERAIGPQVFERDAGHFWGLLETRPYMRARSGLAQCLWDVGERAAAIGHCRDMLRLNPNDNQGLRYVLASWLLTIRDHDALEKLLADYDGDGSPGWAYNRTLLALRRGDETDAHAALAIAWKYNPHVPALLIGAAKMPRYMEDYYALGSPEEAAFYVLENRENWLSTEGAVPWLARSIQDAAG